MIQRALAGLVAACCAALALWLAGHHPLSAAAAVALWGVLAAAVWWRPQWCISLVLTLLPLAGLMPWTGWIAVEELDLVVLAIAAAGYLRLATAAPSASAATSRRMVATGLWLLPFAGATLLAMRTGFVDAGGFEWGWWQGYREPMNSLRLAKPIVELFLLLPLWRLLDAQDEAALTRRLSAGMLALLALVALVVLWERAAFTGLLNFSTDYRATGPFWEMHVGGAALDASLAASLPFALAAVAQARSPWRALGWSLLLALGLYAALVTFSRIVLAAVPVGLVAWWWLRSRSAAARGASDAATTHIRPAALALGLFAGLALLAFPSTGYRGMLALLASSALVLRWPAVMQRVPRLQRRAAGSAGMALGLAGALAVTAAASWLSRGVYLVFALAWAATAAVLLQGTAPRLSQARRASFVLAGTIVTLAALLAVGLHWGGRQALLPAALIVLVLLVALAAGGLREAPPWPQAWRWQVQTLAGAMALVTVIGVLSGGDYLRHRLSAVAEDSGGRQDHWSQSLQMLRGSDWLWGIGLGRFAANRALSGRLEDQTGDYRLITVDGGRAVVISSGKHLAGWAEILRLSQRVAVPAPGPMRLQMDLRIGQKVQMQAEVCEKHLIYAGTCIAASRVFEPKPGVWQKVEIDLPAGNKALSGGAWYAPRFNVFSVALMEAGQRAEIDNLSLVDAAGISLLRNGDFEDGLARWFFSSDRKHLPWHAKSLALHLLIEQGVAGLAAFGVALVAALWRTGAGAARRHPLAPPLFAALLSLMVVGAIDSLFDMPRIALLSLLLVAMSLLLPAPAASRSAAGKT